MAQNVTGVTPERPRKAQNGPKRYRGNARTFVRGSPAASKRPASRQRPPGGKFMMNFRRRLAQKWKSRFYGILALRCWRTACPMGGLPTAPKSSQGHHTTEHQTRAVALTPRANHEYSPQSCPNTWGQAAGPKLSAPPVVRWKSYARAVQALAKRSRRSVKKKEPSSSADGTWRRAKP